MKNIFFSIIVIVQLAFIADKPIDNNCKCRNRFLYGRVKIVERNADFKIRIVNDFPDIKVKLVTSLPNKCGEWKIVENFADFTVQIVDNGEDFKVAFVDNFPGIK